jgi:hypothetical protein
VRGGAEGEVPGFSPGVSDLLIELAEKWGVVSGNGGRRPSGPTCCGRPARWPTSRGAEQWRGGGGAGDQEREDGKALVNFVVHRLKKDFPRSWWSLWGERAWGDVSR